MTINFKRIAAVAVTAVMTVCFCATAFAQEGDVVQNGTLTVTGEQLADKNVTAVRMFTARATEGSTNGEYTFDSYQLEDAWLNFFKATPEQGGIGLDALKAVDGTEFSQQPTDDQYKAAAIKYVASLEDQNLADFAHTAQKWVRSTDHSSDFANLTTTEKATQVDETTKGSAVFTNLQSGYYLVFPEGGSTGNDGRATDAMLIDVPTNHPNATWNIKSTYPTVDKTVQTDSDGNFADDGTAQVGDTVTFKLTATVPDMSDYTTYTLKFVDTLSDGLTFNKDSVAVQIGETLLNSGTDYTVTESNADKTLTVTFEDLKKVTSATTGATITVTYTATINENAVTEDKATNEVHLEYSNDPNSDSTGNSTPDISTVYLYDINIHKYTGTWNNGSTGFLAGAKFVLSKSDVLEGTDPDYTNAIELVKTSTGNENEYRVAKDGEENTVTSFTTNSTGKITIKGLEAGTYYLHEIEAPVGYNKLTQPIEIKIDVTGGYDNPSYSINGTPNTAEDSTIPVENKKGATLPETGGIGTIGLTIAGVAIILVGVCAVPRKKKNEQG